MASFKKLQSVACTEQFAMLAVFKCTSRRHRALGWLCIRHHHLPPGLFFKKKLFLIDIFFFFKKESNINLLFRPFVCSLVESCMYPED